MRYAILLKLPDGVNWFEVCCAESPVACAEVIRILLSQGPGSPGEIRIEVRHG